MTPTVLAARITGHGVDLLSLHTTQRQAHSALVAGCSEVWSQRFGYPLPAGCSPLTAEVLLGAEGYSVRVEELPVEL